MTLNKEPIETLLAQAAADEAARQELLARHRQRLRQMIAVRIDLRLGRRLDPSDVVQEVLAQAWQNLDDYLQRRPLPFYPWLRQLAWERLVKLHRRHIQAQKRSLTREAEGRHGPVRRLGPGPGRPPAGQGQQPQRKGGPRRAV